MNDYKRRRQPIIGTRQLDVNDKFNTTTLKVHALKATVSIVVGKSICYKA